MVERCLLSLCVSLQRSMHKVPLQVCKPYSLVLKRQILSKKVSYLPQKKKSILLKRKKKTFLFSYGSLNLQMLQLTSMHYTPFFQNRNSNDHSGTFICLNLENCSCVNIVCLLVGISPELIN